MRFAGPRTSYTSLHPHRQNGLSDHTMSNATWTLNSNVLNAQYDFKCTASSATAPAAVVKTCKFTMLTGPTSNANLVLTPTRIANSVMHMATLSLRSRSLQSQSQTRQSREG